MKRIMISVFTLIYLMFGFILNSSLANNNTGTLSNQNNISNESIEEKEDEIIIKINNTINSIESGLKEPRVFITMAVLFIILFGIIIIILPDIAMEIILSITSMIFVIAIIYNIMIWLLNYH